MNVLTEVTGPPITTSFSERWIFDCIEGWSRRHPEPCAFVVDHSDRSEEYRYSDVLRFAESIAAALDKSGIKQGDRVGILMENIPHWVFALLGIMRVGSVAVPLATALPESALRRVAEHAACKILFTDAQNVDKACNIANSIGATVVAFGSNDSRATSWDAFLESAGVPPAFPSGIADEPAVLMYTSGTTGDPKGVQLTVRNLICEIQGVSEPLEISGDHRILSVLPFSHVLPLIANGIGALCVGASVVFLSSISPQRIVEAFHKHRITFFICVPQFFYVLHKRIFSQVQAQPFPMRLAFRLMFRAAGWTSNPALRRRLFARIHRTIGPDLRMFASGGSRFDTRVAEDLSRLGYTVLQAYGLTETAAAATATPVRENAVGTVGKPIRGVSIRIDSPDPVGVGEVWIHGPILMKGYYRDDERTRRVMSDGWFHSGDLGYIRTDGNLVITGRSKDVIVLPNGENIYPEELEVHYSQTPYVKELCILGLPERGGGPTGEKLHAVVVPDMDEFRRRGQTAIAGTIRFDLENLSKQLPSYQRILSHSIRNEPLPRTVTRKLKRFEIQKEEMEQRLSAVHTAPATDHARFADGVGAVVAELVRERKPEVGALDVAMNLELDLGFDSLSRVELLGFAESRLGAHVEEKEASRIFTLGELIDALTAAGTVDSGRGRSWAEILSVPSAVSGGDWIFETSAVTKLAWYIVMKTVKLASLGLFRLRYKGLEKLPSNLPYIICPNHQSFLDGPLLIATLPRQAIDNMFILGYSDYWAGAVSRRVARLCHIVPIDPNMNLVRAMQIGALGLKKKRVLLIFPEGTRTIDGHLSDFKKGAAILACELGVPVVPVGIRGAFQAWPRGGSFRFHPIEYVFGEPLDPRMFANAPDPYSSMTDALKEEVRRLAQDI